MSRDVSVTEADLRYPYPFLRRALLAASLLIMSGPAHALIGDVNGDGKVDISDARMVANYLVGNSTGLPHPENADVNNDGKITTADALLITQVAKSLRTAFSSAPLQVLAVMPSSGTTNVLLTAGFNIFFSEPILNGLSSISILDASGLPIAGAVTLSQDGVIATFHPSQPLMPSSSYKISVSTGVTDVGGNPLKQAFMGNFQTQALGTMSLLSVNNSTAAINTLLSQPIAVKAVSSGGAPVANVPVLFTAQMGNGSFQPSGLRQLTVPTDNNGLAQVSYQTGGQALQNTVLISAVGFSTVPAFVVTTMPTPAVNLRLYTGNNQIGSPGGGTIFPLVVQATDAGGDSIAGTTVTFSVPQAQGNFAGQPSVSVVTDSSGTASASFTFGNATGTASVQASFPGMVGQGPSFTLINLIPQPSSPTAVVGRVLDAQTQQPIGHIYVYLADSPSVWDWTDATGFFSLPTSPGAHVVEADGFQSGPINGQLYPVVSVPVNAIQGQNTDVGMPLLLPELDSQSFIDVSDFQGGTLTIRSNPTWQLYVAPGSAHFVNGTTTGRLYAAAVPPDKIPMPVAGGKASRFFDTIQPLNVTFSPPAQVSFPNADNLAPGTVTDIYTLSYASGTFVRTGRAKVSEDGAAVVSLAGQGITAGGWHSAPNPQPAPTFCIHFAVNLGPEVVQSVMTAFGLSANGVLKLASDYPAIGQLFPDIFPVDFFDTVWEFDLCGLPANLGPISPLITAMGPTFPSLYPYNVHPFPHVPLPTISPPPPAPPPSPTPKPPPTVKSVTVTPDRTVAAAGEIVTFTAAVTLTDPTLPLNGIVVTLKSSAQRLSFVGGGGQTATASTDASGNAIFKAQVTDDPPTEETDIESPTIDQQLNPGLSLAASLALVAASVDVVPRQYEADASAIIKAMQAGPADPIATSIANFIKAPDKIGRIFISNTAYNQISSNPDAEAFVANNGIQKNISDTGLRPDLFFSVVSALQSANNPTGGPFSSTDAGIAASAIAHDRRVLHWGETKFRAPPRGIAGVPVTADPASILRTVQWGDKDSGDVPNIDELFIPERETGE